MIRKIQTENVRWHELSDRAIACPNARDYDRQSPYGVKAKTGMWITFRENTTNVDGSNPLTRLRSGRVLGRVDAPSVPSEKYPCERIEGYVSVLALADNMQHAYIRWIKPEDVAEVSANPPAKLLAWITGPLPNADIVHKLSHYGTLSENYIGNAPHHIKAFELGVSPAAYDCGVRKDDSKS